MATSTPKLVTSKSPNRNSTGYMGYSDIREATSVPLRSARSFMM